MTELPPPAAKQQRPIAGRPSITYSQIRISPEPVHPNEQVFYHGSSDEDSEGTRARKRLKREQFAADYLQHGYVPILTAGLKGPFSHGWVNPWAKRNSKLPVVEESPESRRRHDSARVALPTYARQLNRPHVGRKVARSKNALSSPFRMSSELGSPSTPTRKGSDLPRLASKTPREGERSSKRGSFPKTSLNFGEDIPKSNTGSKLYSNRHQMRLSRLLNPDQPLGPRHNVPQGDMDLSEGDHRQDLESIDSQESLQSVSASPSLRKSSWNAKQIRLDRQGKASNSPESSGDDNRPNRQPHFDPLRGRDVKQADGPSRYSVAAANYGNHRSNVARTAFAGGDDHHRNPAGTLHSTPNKQFLDACSKYLEVHESDISDNERPRYEDVDEDEDDEIELEAGILPIWQDASEEFFQAEMYWEYVTADKREGRQILFNQLPIINDRGRVEAFDDENLHAISILLRSASNDLQARLDRTNTEISTAVRVKRIDVLLQLNQTLEKVEQVIDLRECLQHGVFSREKYASNAARLILAQVGAAKLKPPGLGTSLGEFMRRELVAELNGESQQPLSQAESLQNIEEAPRDDASNDGDVEMNDEDDTDSVDAEVVLENDAEHRLVETLRRKSTSEDMDTSTDSIQGNVDDLNIEGSDTQLDGITTPGQVKRPTRSNSIMKDTAGQSTRQEGEIISTSPESAFDDEIQQKTNTEPTGMHANQSVTGDDIALNDGSGLMTTKYASDKEVLKNQQRHSTDDDDDQQKVDNQILELMEETFAEPTEDLMSNANNVKQAQAEVILIESDSEIDDRENVEWENKVTSITQAKGKAVLHTVSTPGDSRQSVERANTLNSTDLWAKLTDEDQEEGKVIISGTAKDDAQGVIKSTMVSQTTTWSSGHPVRAVLALDSNKSADSAPVRQLSNVDDIERQSVEAGPASGNTSSIENLATEPPLLKWPTLSEADQVGTQDEFKRQESYAVQDNVPQEMTILESPEKAESSKPLNISSTVQFLISGPSLEPLTTSKSQPRQRPLLDSADPNISIGRFSASQPVKPSMSMITNLDTTIRFPGRQSSSTQDSQRHNTQIQITDEEERLALDDAQAFLSAWAVENKSLLETR